MQCEICLNVYDHSKHKPFFLSCPHTFCVECLNRLKENKCPACQKPYAERYPNLALLQLVPRSPYDLLKSDLENCLNDIADLKVKLDECSDRKLKDNLVKITCLRADIKKKTNEIINSIQNLQKKLLNETCNIEVLLRKKYTINLIDDQIEAKSKEARLGMEVNAFSEADLRTLLDSFSRLKPEISDRIHQVETQTDDEFEFALKSSIEIDTGDFGEIINKNSINNWNWSEDIYNERSIDEQVNESEHVKEAELELPATIEAEKKSTDGNFKPTVKFSETDIQLLARGKSLVHSKKFDEAIELYERLITMCPNNAKAHNGKGNALYGLKDYMEAIKCYNKAIEIDPTVAVHFINLAHAYNCQGIYLSQLKNFKDAIYCFNKAIEIDPKDALYHNNKGIANFNSNNFQEALECYNRAIEINPKNVIAYIGKGKTLQKLNNLNEASICFQIANKLRNQN